MEQLIVDEVQQLMKPICEVAIMAGALLPGDASPKQVVEATMAWEEEFDSNNNEEDAEEYENFYNDSDNNDEKNTIYVH